MTWLELFLVAAGVAAYFSALVALGVVAGRMFADPYRHRSQDPLEDVEARRQEREAEGTLYPHASKRRR